MEPSFSILHKNWNQWNKIPSKTVSLQTRPKVTSNFFPTIQKQHKLPFIPPQNSSHRNMVYIEGAFNQVTTYLSV